MELKLDVSGIEKFQQQLQGMPGKFERVLRLALKRAAQAVEIAYAKEITHTYNVKYGEVRRSMTHSITDNAIEVLVRGRRTSIRDFKLRPQNTPHKRKPRGYVSYEIHKGKRVKDVDAFIMSYAHNVPMTRRTRNEIFHLTGPAIPQLADNTVVTEPIQDKVQQQFMNQLRYQTMKALGVMR